MAGNIEDKAKYALKDYEVRRGGGCTWYVSGVTGREEKFTSCLYDQWGANSPAKVVRVLKEKVLASGMQPKSYVAPPSPLEKFEGTLYDRPDDLRIGKEEYKMGEAVDRTLDVKSGIGEKAMNMENKAAGLDRAKIKTIAKAPIVLVVIAIGVIGYFLFAGRRG
jgi:hypothetical protein